MTLESIDIETGSNPTASIIVLHGLGADGNDFVPICDELELESVGPVRYVLPHAPTRKVTINAGYVMRAWYDILGTELTRIEDEAGLRASQREVQALIARENARGVPSHRIVLAGFSQGCAMTLLTGVRHGERLAGLVGLSGYLPLASTTATECNPANRDVPIFQAHGLDDPMIRLQQGQATRDALLALGYPVEWHEYPMEHGLCLEEVADLNVWLLRVLGPSTT